MMWSLVHYKKNLIVLLMRELKTDFEPFQQILSKAKRFVLI